MLKHLNRKCVRGSVTSIYLEVLPNSRIFFRFSPPFFAEPFPSVSVVLRVSYLYLSLCHLPRFSRIIGVVPFSFFPWGSILLSLSICYRWLFLHTRNTLFFSLRYMLVFLFLMKIFSYCFVSFSVQSCYSAASSNAFHLCCSYLLLFLLFIQCSVPYVIILCTNVL